MGRRCCCGCPYVEDDFNRDDSDDLGVLWVPNEDARIVDKTLEIDADYVICKQAIWDSEGSFLLTIGIDDPVDDDDIYDVVLLNKHIDTYTEKYRIRFTPSSVTGYWTVGYKASGEATFWTDDVELISGCGTYQEEYLAGRRFSISFDRLVMRVGGTTPDAPHYEFWKCEDYDNWTHVALGHGGGPRPVKFNYFWLSDHWVHNPLCPFWGCTCGGTPA